MQVQNMSCPKCGAPLIVPSDVDHLLCIYCNSQLRVQSGEGYVALKAIEKLGQVIQDSNMQTQQKIGEGTQVTQMELQRLQLTQELTTAQLQFSNLQAEIRTLERGGRNRKANKQLRELRIQEKYLVAQIATLQAVLMPQSKSPDQSLGRKWDSFFTQGFQWGCLGILIFFTLCSGFGMFVSGSTKQRELGKTLISTPTPKATATSAHTVSSIEVANTQSKILIPTVTLIPAATSEPTPTSQVSQSTRSGLTTSAGAIGSVTVVVEKANIRSGPSLNASIESVVKRGTQFLAYSKLASGEWIAINNKGDRWIAASTVNFSEEGDISGILPGITKNQIAGLLKQHGLSCGNTTLGSAYYVQDCKLSNSDYELWVTIYGAAPQTVDFVNSSALSFGKPDDSRALALFRIIASLPYAGAEPNNSKNWVEQTLPTITANQDVRSLEIGGVNYQLFGWPKARNLQVGDLR